MACSDSVSWDDRTGKTWPPHSSVASLWLGVCVGRCIWENLEHCQSNGGFGPLIPASLECRHRDLLPEIQKNSCWKKKKSEKHFL